MRDVVGNRDVDYHLVLVQWVWLRIKGVWSRTLVWAHYLSQVAVDYCEVLLVALAVLEQLPSLPACLSVEGYQQRPGGRHVQTVTEPKPWKERGTSATSEHCPSRAAWTSYTQIRGARSCSQGQGSRAWMFGTPDMYGAYLSSLPPPHLCHRPNQSEAHSLPRQPLDLR